MKILTMTLGLFACCLFACGDQTPAELERADNQVTQAAKGGGGGGCKKNCEEPPPEPPACDYACCSEGCSVGHDGCLRVVDIQCARPRGCDREALVASCDAELANCLNGC